MQAKDSTQIENPFIDAKTDEPTLAQKLTQRPIFPARAIVTAGMPYGNKGLHFGHIGGVFVPADIYARFLRDRIGAENVLFISGTDCYGSPIEEGYRKLVENEGYTGSIEDYVMSNHNAQAQTLNSYEISLDIFEGSGFGKSKEAHQAVTDSMMERLHFNKHLKKQSTKQFYDAQVGSFLNGRQVIGRCPIAGCKSEFAYADECSLGHQYMPEDLIAPKSVLSNMEPEMREVENWYFDLPNFRGVLKNHIDNLRADGVTRDVVIKTMEDFLVPPIIYVKNEHEEQYLALANELPPHTHRNADTGKASFELEFSTLEDRDAARVILDTNHMRYRTGKTLVPLRMTGNIKWGVTAPTIGGVSNLTVWVWPESLWAPVSFTKTYLDARGQGIETLNTSRASLQAELPKQNWRDYWCNTDAAIYQFIGQDNIYFYGIAQPALWAALPAAHAPQATPLPGEFRQSNLIANYHLLFLNKKASSSSAIKPPMADELLNYYTSEQLRAHFMALGLALKPVSFQPKPLNPAAKETDADPVLKEGQLLTNVFNRLARSCFYTAQKISDSTMPLGNVRKDLVVDSLAVILEYERLMHKQELHAVIQLMSEYIRKANKYWSDEIRAAGEDIEIQLSVLRDAFYLLRVCTVLMHPIVPRGTEMIFEYLNLPNKHDEFFSWDNIFAGFEAFTSDFEKKDGAHLVKTLPPRTDFFERHPSQH